jgi:hypothetical protein
MSLVNRQSSSGEHFFMVVIRFFETFAGSMSAGVGVGFTSALISFLESSIFLIRCHMAKNVL